MVDLLKSFGDEIPVIRDDTNSTNRTIRTKKKDYIVFDAKTPEQKMEFMNIIENIRKNQAKDREFIIIEDGEKIPNDALKNGNGLWI